jgi:Dcp1-like decapping family
MLTQNVLKRQLALHQRIMDDTPSLNMRVLTRHNHNITSVVDKSSYCVVYTFSTASSSWTKAGYEGTLFIYIQRPHTIQTDQGEEQGGQYGFCVLNRMSLENFWGELNGGDIVLDDQYIITRSLTGGVSPITTNGRGIWIMALRNR